MASVWIEGMHPRNPDGTFTYKVTNLPGGGVMVTSSSRVNKTIRSGGGGTVNDTGSKVTRSFVSGQSSMSSKSQSITQGAKAAATTNTSPVKRKKRRRR
jgi:hypothetical protein